MFGSEKGTFHKKIYTVYIVKNMEEIVYDQSREAVLCGGSSMCSKLLALRIIFQSGHVYWIVN